MLLVAVPGFLGLQAGSGGLRGGCMLRGPEPLCCHSPLSCAGAPVGPLLAWNPPVNSPLFMDRKGTVVTGMAFDVLMPSWL